MLALKHHIILAVSWNSCSHSITALEHAEIFQCITITETPVPNSFLLILYKSSQSPQTFSFHTGLYCLEASSMYLNMGHCSIVSFHCALKLKIKCMCSCRSWLVTWQKGIRHTTTILIFLINHFHKQNSFQEIRRADIVTTNDVCYPVFSISADQLSHNYKWAIDLMHHLGVGQARFKSHL